MRTGFTHDSLSRQTTEKWYDNLTDADAQQNVRKTYTTTYDEGSRVASVGDGSYDFDYTYSIFGNLTSTTQDLTGLTDDVLFAYAYDVLGRKTSVSAKVGSTDDYVSSYSYDTLGRITQLTQDGVSGGNAVAEKRVDFAYNDDGTRATISRFADLAGTKSVAETEKLFDQLGRVTDIVHERAATEFADYDLAWDAASRITDFDFESLVGDDGDADYWYDDTNQLTGSDYASDWQTDESYVYDDNGNRTLVDGSTAYTTGDHNRLTSDGTYAYEYDNEGNRTARFVDNDSSGTLNSGDTSITEYEWDHRNRATKVTTRDTYGGAATKIVEYAYDFGQRWVRKTLDTNGDGTIESSRIFVHDDGQIVLDFQKTGTSVATNADLANRYLWGNSVDELLTDELVDDGSEDDNRWAATDHLNSVRDLLVYDSVTQTVSVIKHVTFDAFGQETSDSAPGLITLHGFTARPYDPDTNIQNNLNRWYDLSTGRWMSVDPIGFEAGDVNVYRYVGNTSPVAIDPLGLWKIVEWFTFEPWKDRGKGTGRHVGKVIAGCNDDWKTLAYLVTGEEGDVGIGDETGPPVPGTVYSVRRLLQLNEDRMRENVANAINELEVKFGRADNIIAYDADVLEQNYFGAAKTHTADCQQAAKLILARGVMKSLGASLFDALNYSYGNLPMKEYGRKQLGLPIGPTGKNISQLRPRDLGDWVQIDNVNPRYQDKHPTGSMNAQNVIRTHDGRLWGHGGVAAVRTYDEWLQKLADAYNKKPNAEDLIPGTDKKVSTDPTNQDQITADMVWRYGGVGHIRFPDVGTISTAAFNERLKELGQDC